MSRASWAATTRTYQQGLPQVPITRTAGILNGGTYYVMGKVVPFWMVYENTEGLYAARSKV